MKFAHPWWLAGSLLSVLVASFLVLSGFLLLRSLRTFGEEQRMMALLTGRAGTRRAVKGVLLILGLAMAFVAAAQPQYGRGTRLIPATNLDVVIALDYSKSMYARDVTPSRIARAQAEVGRLIADLPGARFAAVAFAGEPLGFPLTSDGAAIAQFFRQLSPNDMPVGGTAIARALEAGRELLARDPLSKQHRRVMVLVTDGEDLEGDPVSVAQAATLDQVAIHVVQIGGRTPEPIPEVNPAGEVTGWRKDESGQPITTSLTAEGEAVLSRVAEATGGMIVRAERGSTGIHEVAAALKRMMSEELSEKVETVYADVFHYPLGLSILLLLLETLVPQVPRRVTPTLLPPPPGGKSPRRRNRSRPNRSPVSTQEDRPRSASPALSSLRRSAAHVRCALRALLAARVGLPTTAPALPARGLAPPKRVLACDSARAGGASSRLVRRTPPLRGAVAVALHLTGHAIEVMRRVRSHRPPPGRCPPGQLAAGAWLGRGGGRSRVARQSLGASGMVWVACWGVVGLSLAGCERAERLFTRHSPVVDQALASLDAGDAQAATDTLEQYLSTGKCEAGKIGTPEQVRTRGGASLDLGLGLFQLGEKFGRRFGEEEPGGDGGPGENSNLARRSEQVDCALAIVRAIAGNHSLTPELRARAHYLAGNLELLRREYRASLTEYDQALLLIPGVSGDAGDNSGRDAAHNRAIALRRLEEQEKRPDAGSDAGPDSGFDAEPDAPETGPDSGDSGDNQDSGADASDSGPEGGSGDDGSAPDAGGPDSGRQDQPDANDGAAPDPKPSPQHDSPSQDERVLEMLERAPTLQEAEAKNRAQHRRLRGAMEDK